jgi:hypothetical protein
VITMLLCYLSDDRPHDWLRWLPWTEFCYNSRYQSSLKTSPFKVVYGRDLPSVCSYTLGRHACQLSTSSFWAEIHEWLELAQQRYKSYCGRNHCDVEYEVGQWVWLRLLHHPVASLPGQSCGKLRPHFFDPFKILARVGAIAYQL